MDKMSDGCDSSDFPSLGLDWNLRCILNPTLSPIYLPRNVVDISSALGKGSPPYRNLTMAAVQLKRSGKADDGRLDQVASWLEALHKVELLDPRYKTNSSIDKALKIVMDPIYRFPSPFPEVAKAILQELDDANWGEEVGSEVEGREALSSEMSDIEADGSSPLISSTTTQATPTTQNRTEAVQIEAADDDPIFGINGIMHDINISKGPSGRAKTYPINPNYNKPSSKVFGHNGIAVGTVWPLQKAAFRDGAHGRPMAGISGTVEEGCYSVVVSGAYDGVDQDLGHTLYYSDSKALVNKAAAPIDSPGTTALRVSMATGKPVRVLRTSGGKWYGRPQAGIRYDGLYRVVEATIKTNSSHGGYVQFKLERIVDETNGEIDILAPSPAMVALFKQVQLGITRRRI